LEPCVQLHSGHFLLLEDAYEGLEEYEAAEAARFGGGAGISELARLRLYIVAKGNESGLGATLLVQYRKGAESDSLVKDLMFNTGR